MFTLQWASRRGLRLKIRDWEAIRAKSILLSVGGLTKGVVMRKDGAVSVVVRLVILAGIVLQARFQRVFTKLGGSQEGRLSKDNEWSREYTYSSYIEGYQ